MAETTAVQRFVDGAPQVLVVGATGFAGALAAHLLWRHPRLHLAGVTGRSEVGMRLDALYPRYRVPLVLQELDLDAIAPGAIDAAIVAYPHGASAPTVAALRERDVRVVDLSADFRLCDLSTYERWYGEHPRPDLLDEAVYGLTELHRDQIAAASLVANPGCYPTAALLALAPLARAGLIADVVIDAKQGVSGVGRTPTATSHLSTVAENIIPYNVAAHRHTPEIEEQLALLGTDLAVQFQAHLVPIDQGEMASCYVTPTRAIGQSEVDELYRAAYDHEPFIEVNRDPPIPPGVREVRETNFCRLFAATDDHTAKVLVFAAIDNIWKGTSSQAIQNLNLMFDLDEREGLL